MILKVEHLEMVAAIQKEGTVTGAAKVLHVTQPALSRRLKKLERRLGAQLFRRDGSRMGITPEGRRILRTAERFLGELRRTEQDVKLLAEGLDGIVRIATECHICYHWLPRVVRRFQALYPKVEIRIVPEATRDPLAALADGTLDLAVVYHTAPTSRDTSLVELFTDELVAVVNADHVLAERPFLHADDFRQVSLICHYAEPERSVLDLAVLRPAGVRPRQVMEMQVTPAVMEMVRAGLGITVIPRWLLKAERTEGLRVVPVSADGLFRTWYAATSRRSALPAIPRLVELLREETSAEAQAPADDPPMPAGDPSLRSPEGSRI